MTIQTVNGATAVAQSAKNCSPDVVSGYPITPTTHVVEEMAKYYANGETKNFIGVESEFSALSALIGGAATGCRTFTATGAQGLLLMHEVLFCTSGMRLPVVMVVGNRSISAPLSIWNDEQDSVSQRDTGWIQIYCKSNQEAADAIPQAYYIAEKTSIPVMVCIDGHFLTHTTEQVDLLTKEQINQFLPVFVPVVTLDPENPVSLGVYAAPTHYQEFRMDLAADLNKSVDVIIEAGKKFGRLFNRPYGLIEEYRTKDATEVIIGLGSAMENVKAVVDEQRKKGKRIGALHLRILRPFPREHLRKALSGKRVGVIDRAISPGSQAPLYTEVAEALQDTQSTVSSFYGALGGRSLKTTEIGQ
ncbi:MAG: pyruvate ferredoxin oxidoreductase, partial [Candidatus Diapherotrites archaeon]|nr:pyruvate ferredoxin oxidoreductase [Candidatus Diapherotrites archaeon]